MSNVAAANIDDPLLDTEQAAAIIGSTPNFLEKLRTVGGGPAYAKLGRIVRYRRSALDRWIDDNTIGATNGARRRRPTPAEVRRLPANDTADVR